MAAVVLLLGLSSAVGGPPGDSAEEADALIASVVRRYATASAYEIDFTQESYWALADSTQMTSGTLAVIPPSRIAIRYEDGGSIIADGESLWVYVAQTNQFFSARLDSADTFLDPLRLLSSYKPDASKPFAQQSSASPGWRTVTLRPSPPAVEPPRLDVEIDVDARLVRGLTAHSSAGDRTRYALRETRLGAPIPESTFTPAPPAGVERIRGTPYGG